MAKKVSIKAKVNLSQGKKKPVKPSSGDAGVLSEKVIIVVKKKKGESK